MSWLRRCAIIALSQSYGQKKEEALVAYETVMLEKKDGVGVLTLNRPDKMNALNRTMELELVTALAAIDQDDDIRVLVLTGAGKAFCSGADLASVPGGLPPDQVPGAEELRMRFRERLHKIVLGIHRLKQPTIAMINGAAVGGGLDLACVCDIRLAAEDARLTSGFVRIGLFPGTGGTWLMPRLIGLGQAFELLYTGDVFDARRAQQLGLVSRVVPADELEAETMALARRIAAGPPIAIRLVKLLTYRGLELDLEAALDLAAAAETITLTSKDHREGVAALRQKREPVFRGE